MNTLSKLLGTAGRIGLCSLMVFGSVGEIAWSADASVEPPTPVTQPEPPTSTLPAPADQPGHSTNHDGEKADAEKVETKIKKTEDKNTTKTDGKSTTRAKLLVILLKLFEGHKGAAP